MCGLISGSLIQFQLSTCLFLCQYQTVFIFVEFDLRDGDISGSSFIVKNCFGCPGVFVFPYEVDYFSFKVCEELHGILMGIALNLQIVFGRIVIFIMLILPIQELGRSFHFLVSSSISFFKDVKFLLNRSFTSLVSVSTDILGYLWLLWKVMFLWFFSSASLLFVYRRATDFFFLVNLVSCYITEGIY